MDETNEKNLEGEGIESVEGEIPEKKTTADEKKFSQKELDTLIQSRLKREKDALSTASKNWDSEKEEYLSKLDTLEKITTELLEEAKQNLSEGEKILLGKLSVLDQIEYLQGVDKKNRKTIPTTPRGTQENTNNKDTKIINKFKF